MAFGIAIGGQKVLHCAAQEEKQRIHSRESGGQNSARNTEAQDIKFLQEFAASRTEMADIATALSSSNKSLPEAPSARSADVPSSAAEPTAEEAENGGGEEVPAPLTREAALEVLAERCKQALGFSSTQVCMPCHVLAAPVSA